ncbi:hypothetical protein A2707_01035 [Candidatus Saccharibacteria bacterium RIFCSPHIGHO2_01_FULL_45_15]|nr:MAG: hypothetical protein A2707_01035 [Candidatus Saccharibacteria bacterium RIFCSPHIGHO2_01_FULL_45_15]OGL26957.1 MAG: hypothetical protein A3C39_02150 [Candidatus Saccharibacteria bacterium RIFCSPHIGHO2_02_FULL_46_12]OGL32311.1 MAG: hypothetical protein A3E76_02860 [Candidatus Saccharibacteria bacterium RIFCSPHIGHO2_12_FULL_44_22]
MSERQPPSEYGRFDADALQSALPFSDIDYSHAPSSFPELEYSAEAPTNSAQILLNADISRNTRESSLMSRQFSQTPLLPSKLFELGHIAYPTAVEMLLVDRINQSCSEANLPEVFHQAIEFEISLESDRRRIGNDNAGRRLKNYLGDVELSDDDAQLLWRARTGDASMAETAELLLRYPIMGAIEAAKHTEPLKWNGVANTDIHITSGLEDFASHISDPSKVHAIWFSANDQRRGGRAIDPLKAIEDPQVRERQHVIAGMKDNLAQITNGTTTIELVRKRTLIMLPDSLALNGITKVPKRVLDSELINLQPIATSCYWRTIDAV